MDGTLVLFVSLGFGIVLLVAGGELLVRGASTVAALFGITPLVIGLTVVAFGTSAPELAVSVQAGLSGNANIAVANVVGSNIFNVLFILGACALVAPLLVSRQLVRREVPLMIGISLLLLALAADGTVGRGDAGLLFAGIVAYTTWSVLESRAASRASRDDDESVTIDVIEAGGTGWLIGFGSAALVAVAGHYAGWWALAVAVLVAGGGTLFVAGALLASSPTATLAGVARQAGLILVGLGMLVHGAALLVDAATAIARAAGVSDVIIGLTIVAAGTSLPEVATSIVATLRNERDIAIGNVVGSNIFNILCILGLAGMITPAGLTVDPAMLRFDLPIMIAVAVACLPIFFTGFSIARWEGLLFLASYVAYTAFLVLVATESPALETFANAMLLVLPLIAVTLGWTAFQALFRGNRRPHHGG